MPTFVRGIDVSSHQSRDLKTLITTHRPAHVVVKLYLPVESIPKEHSLAQIASARAEGCTVGGYVWCYGEEDPRKTVRDAVGLARSAGVELPILWLDCETYKEDGVVVDAGPDAAWLREAIDECRTLGVKPGIYTGGWWWREHLDNTREFADLPLWAAEYDDNPDVDDVTLFGGWARASGKQYAEKLPSGGRLDQNVFRDKVTGGGSAPPPGRRWRSWRRPGPASVGTSWSGNVPAIGTARTRTTTSRAERISGRSGCSIPARSSLSASAAPPLKRSRRRTRASAGSLLSGSRPGARTARIPTSTRHAAATSARSEPGSRPDRISGLLQLARVPPAPPVCTP